MEASGELHASAALTPAELSTLHTAAVIEPGTLGRPSHSLVAQFQFQVPLTFTERAAYGLNTQ